MREETNIEHAANPQVGDYWHERFSPAFLVIDVSRFSVSFLSKTKRVLNGITWEQDTFWDTSYIVTCTHKEFQKRVSYGSIPGTWCDCIPNWKPAAEYIEEALEAAA